MFCSGCGAQVQSGLNYCNRCGKRVAESESEASSIAESLASSLGYIGGFGFIGYIFVALILVKNGIPPDVLVKITFVYFASLVGICLLVLRQAQLFKKKEPVRYQEPASEAPAYLRPITTAQLPESHDHPASVVDHTTRTLDEVPARKL